jgi:hypothetical protein
MCLLFRLATSNAHTLLAANSPPFSRDVKCFFYFFVWAGELAHVNAPSKDSKIMALLKNST